MSLQHNRETKPVIYERSLRVAESNTKWKRVFIQSFEIVHHTKRSPEDLYVKGTVTDDEATQAHLCAELNSCLFHL